MVCFKVVLQVSGHRFLLNNRPLVSLPYVDQSVQGFFCEDTRPYSMILNQYALKIMVPTRNSQEIDSPSTHPLIHSWRMGYGEDIPHKKSERIMCWSIPGVWKSGINYADTWWDKRNVKPTGHEWNLFVIEYDRKRQQCRVFPFDLPEPEMKWAHTRVWTPASYILRQCFGPNWKASYIHYGWPKQFLPITFNHDYWPWFPWWWLERKRMRGRRLVSIRMWGVKVWKQVIKRWLLLIKIQLSMFLGDKSILILHPITSSYKPDDEYKESMGEFLVTQTLTEWLWRIGRMPTSNDSTAENCYPGCNVDCCFISSINNNQTATNMDNLTWSWWWWSCWLLIHWLCPACSMQAQQNWPDLIN